VTPAQRGRGAARLAVSGADPTKPSTPRHVAMSWARRLKRVFGVEIEHCTRCGGELKIIASIEEAQLIAKIDIEGLRAPPFADRAGTWFDAVSSAPGLHDRIRRVKNQVSVLWVATAVAALEKNSSSCARRAIPSKRPEARPWRSAERRATSL